MSSSERSDAIRGWASSGLMALTGATSGPPMIGPGDPAGLVASSLERLRIATAQRTGRNVPLPDARLLGERAALAGLHRQAPLSCGGAFRTVPAQDGHVGLSLARRADLDLLPALVESDLLAQRVDTVSSGDGRAPDWAWGALAAWAARVPVEEAVARARSLGLPIAGVPAMQTPLGEPGWDNGVRVLRQGGARDPRAVGRAPLVVDLTSLWAGPLCAHLLGLVGCQVLKVEAVHRPDGARRGPARFFDLLHGDHHMVAIDFTSSAGRESLARLIEQADVVLEASRPRALQQLGIDADQVVDAGTTWLSITAEGRDSDAVGFGDDVAVSAGLFIRDHNGVPAPCGDALADPLTGVVAAAAVADSLLGHSAQLLEVSMRHVAQAAATRATAPAYAVIRQDNRWWVEHDGGSTAVADPWARQPVAVSGAMGADNAVVPW